MSTTTVIEPKVDDSVARKHEEIDPNHTCPACMTVKARMKDAAEIADLMCTDRFGKQDRGSKLWYNAYFAALARSR